MGRVRQWSEKMPIIVGKARIMVCKMPIIVGKARIIVRNMQKILGKIPIMVGKIPTNIFIGKLTSLQPIQKYQDIAHVV